MLKNSRIRLSVLFLIAALCMLTAVGANASSGSKRADQAACKRRAPGKARRSACQPSVLSVAPSIRLAGQRDHGHHSRWERSHSEPTSTPAVESESAPPPKEEPKTEPETKHEEPAPETKHEEPIPEVPSIKSENCYSVPSACGYPDPTNTGATGTLTASGSITASTNGEVIEGKEITGQITVEANNVTIRNDKITSADTGSGSAGIWVQNGHTGTKVINTTVSGKGSGSSTVEAAIRSYSGVTVEGSRLTLCNECVQAWPLTVKNTYMKVSSIYSGAHAEDIYVCSGSVDVEHSTLVNEQGQTATVFGDTICGGGNKFTVTNSLLVGGGFVLYSQANSTNPSGAQTTITGNHFARCLSKPVYNSGSGGTSCQSGTDSNGLYPNGGYYGVGAYFSGPTTWQGNVWDDNLATVPEP